MGKKGKRSTKAGDGKAKQGPGKARRERTLAMKEIRAGVAALIERLESETTDVELFGYLPEQEECPICFLPLPHSNQEQVYMSCCGQYICGGCAHSAMLISKNTKKLDSCAFCRSETGQDDKAIVAQMRDRLEKNDAGGITTLAESYRMGSIGLPRDEVMAVRLHLRAAELGSLAATNNLANTFFWDGDVPQDAVFAMQLGTLAAKKGCLEAYQLLGNIYHANDDAENAAKSWIFAARAGSRVCMELLQNYKIDGTDVVSDDGIEAIEEAYMEAAKVEWSEDREAFKKVFL